MEEEWELPRLRASIALGDERTGSALGDTEFFDVKFYPYLAEGEDAIFAAVSKKHMAVYRLNEDLEPGFELIQLIRDKDADAVNCSCTWSKDGVTELPYLCVAGYDAKIKVYDVVHAKAVRVLTGHGAEINDLATCPTNPSLIASASDDTTVRIWSLDADDADQPCVAILAGEGHTAHLLATAFHSCGRYVLSAGHDNRVCMWTLPDLSVRPRDKKPPPPAVVHYPHFYTSEVHSGIVDCVAFFGDLILSRACHEDIIVLWRIEGFSSLDPVPPAWNAPTSRDIERLTRSAFAPASYPNALHYTRLIQFATPGSGHQFYMRFNMFQAPDKHPVLAFANAHSKIYFWDLSRFAAYHDFLSQPAVQPPPFLQGRNGTASRWRDMEDQESTYSGRTGSTDAEASRSSSVRPYKIWEYKYDIDRPELCVLAHSTITLPVRDFIGRQVAWSANGKWCVVVGSQTLCCILQRWSGKDGKNTVGGPGSLADEGSGQKDGFR